MKKTNLIEEYNKINIPGSYNTKKTKNFFGSTLFELEDTLIIKEDTIEYFDNSVNGEQLGTNETKKMIDFFQIKKINHSVMVSNSQKEINKSEFILWEFDINTLNIVKEYYKSLLKKERVLENITTNESYWKNINLTLDDFIHSNILNRIKINNISLIIKENKLINSNQNLYLKPNYKKFDIPYPLNYSDFIVDGVENNIKENLPETIKLKWKQKKKANEWIFDYLFWINISKI